MRAKTVKEVLIAIKWILENIGWCKGTWSKYLNGKPVAFCLSGACNTVEPEYGWLIEDARQAMRDVIYDVAPNRDIASFNDSTLTTKKDVIRMLDKAIKQCYDPK